MNTHNDYNITPIKLENKTSTKQLEEQVEYINNILYLLNYLYASGTTKQYIQQQLINTANNVKQLKQSPRQQELLQQLRILYKNTKQIPSTQLPDELIQKVNSLMVSKYLKDKKDKTLTTKQYLHWLNTINIFKQCYTVKPNLISVNNEILKYFAIQ